DQHLRERGFYESVEFAEVGRRPLIGRPYLWRSRATSIGVAAPAPSWGEANGYVLRDLLGYDEARIAELHESGAVADAPVDPPPCPPVDLGSMLESGVASIDRDFALRLGLDEPAPA